MIASSFRGAQLVEPIVRDIPQPQPVSTVYVDPAYRIRPYLTCAKGYTQFWGTLGCGVSTDRRQSFFEKGQVYLARGIQQVALPPGRFIGP